MLPDQIKKFIEVFSKLPAIGPRLATRLAFYLIKLDRQTFKNLAVAFVNLSKLNKCPRCFSIKETSQKLCPICSDNRRNKSILAIVEKETDILSIEKTDSYSGTYLVLGDFEGENLNESQKLRLKHLNSLVKSLPGKKFEEVIIAVNPNTKSDIIAAIIRKEIEPLASKTSRLGRGIPTGGEIEFADPETLSAALKNRR